MNNRTSLQFAVITLLFSLLQSCAGGKVLEEVDEAEASLNAEGSVENTEGARLSSLLQTLGYQGVGLQYESEATLKKLHAVFTEPSTHGRNIQLIYTGVEMAYDSRYQSLTIRAQETKAKIVRFIQQHTPKKKKSK